MKNTKNYNSFYALLILIFFAFGCRFNNIKAEETGGDTSLPNNYKTENNLQPKKRSADISNVVGVYDYDTEKDGEGYDNSLEITDAGDGKLYIYISGSYIYKIGDTQLTRDAEGKGDAVISGNRADAALVDEAGKSCRARIIFKDAVADVKIPDTCQFSIALDGSYRKVNSKTEKKIESGSTYLKSVSYEKMMDFVNDFDAHKIGEEFVLTDVPGEILNRKDRADEFGNSSYKDLYFLQGINADDTPSYSVLTGKQMIENLADRNSETKILRMTAVIVESKGKFDVYRMPFVTKIEGISDDGETAWTATGTKSVQLNFTH